MLLLSLEEKNNDTKENVILIWSRQLLKLTGQDITIIKAYRSRHYHY